MTENDTRVEWNKHSSLHCRVSWPPHIMVTLSYGSQNTVSVKGTQRNELANSIATSPRNFPHSTPPYKRQRARQSIMPITNPVSCNFHFYVFPENF